MVDEKKAPAAKADAPKADKDGCFKVKNLRSTPLNLASGKVEAGKTGKATAAELSTLSKYIEVV